MDSVQLSQQDFATKLNISPASLSSIFTGRTNPTNNHVMAIHRAFPNVNISWLMFGEGSMLVDEGISHTVPDSDSSDFDVENQINKNAESELNVNTVNVPNSLYNSQAEAPRVDSISGFNAGVVSPGGYNNSSMRANMEYMNRARIMERKERKIKEIRVFYDDGTYESFAPTNK